MQENPQQNPKRGLHDCSNVTTAPFVAYNHRYRTLALETAGTASDNFYSIDIGNVHLITVNSYQDFVSGH